jgi:hypothetical protein
MKTTPLHKILYVIAAVSTLISLLIFGGAKSIMHEIAAMMFATQTTIILCTTAVIQVLKGDES